jgi:predicted dehydrogenase
MDASTTRRAFLRQSLATAGLALPCFIASDVLGMQGTPGANGRVRIGVAGIGARGKDLIANVPPQGRVAAVCDCYTARTAGVLKPDAAGPLAERLQHFWETDAARCTAYQDFRRMIDREKLDAVIVCVPDHNHVLLEILALQAGLDLYAEKPLTLTIAEGRALANAVRRYGRICQVGSQQRSMEMNRFACQFVRDGGIGRVSLVQTSNFPGPMRYADLPEEPKPQGMDWDLFCGPTPLRPYNVKLWD